MNNTVDYISKTLTVMEWDKKNGNLIIDRILFHLDYMSGTFTFSLFVTCYYMDTAGAFSVTCHI